ncbi:VOC family protein [Sphingobacterium suaedae]|uniref:VOC family protein n=1 Tax=Sphingobacterium suaedae TaxID=1686402 RepID=A0ABW5KI38_9SPHI
MNKNIYPAIWFNNNAKQAFERYTNLFPNSTIRLSNPVAISADLLHTPFIGINGGPHFTPNPSISFMVICEKKEEIDTLYHNLTSGGEVLMPLQAYPWSPYYGWVNDTYHVSWQLYQGSRSDVNEQAIVPTLMFCGEQQGKCEEALAFYRTVFNDFQSQGIDYYQDGDMQGQVMHTQFMIHNYTVMAMDSGVPQPFTFNEGISIVIECANQQEIDYYWNAFVGHGGEESRCGWCKDPYGVSWQVVPKHLHQLLQDYPQANDALMNMNKIVINDLKK